MVKEPTLQDIFDVLQVLSTHIDERFVKIDQRFEQIDNQLTEIRSDLLTKKEFRREFDPLRQNVHVLCQQLAQSVTKDYLEGRLAHAHG